MAIVYIVVTMVMIMMELEQLRCMIDDDPHLFTAEIILNLLLSYREIQVRILY